MTSTMKNGAPRPNAYQRLNKSEDKGNAQSGSSHNSFSTARKRSRSQELSEALSGPRDDTPEGSPAPKRPRLENRIGRGLQMRNKGSTTAGIKGQKLSGFNTALLTHALDGVKKGALEDKLRAELKMTADELKTSQEEVAKLQKQNDAFNEASQKGAVSLAERISRTEQASSSRELEAMQEKLHHVEQALAKSRSEVAHLNQTVVKNEERIRSLLPQLSSSSDRRGKSKARDEFGMDVFDNRLDQVSEADIKSRVESLNDSMVSLVTDVLEAVDLLAARQSTPTPNPTEPFADGLLFSAFMQGPLTVENRGLLLDAILHDRLNMELHELFFSSDVAPIRINPDGLIQKIFDQLKLKESWTVVQRWRALAATGLSTMLANDMDASAVDLAGNIVELLAWAHGLSPPKFGSISDMILLKIRALFKEAHDLSIRARRDVLAVRMSIVSSSSSTTHPALFDPLVEDQVWPEMGREANDEAVGRYRFGLARLMEDGTTSCLAKPQVVTTALLRVTSRS